MNLVWIAILLITSIVAIHAQTNTIFDSRKDFDRTKLVNQLNWIAQSNFDESNFPIIQLGADDTSMASQSFGISFKLKNVIHNPSALSFPVPRIDFFDIKHSTAEATTSMWYPLSVKLICSEAVLHIDSQPKRQLLEFIFESINEKAEKWNIKWSIERVEDSNKWKIVVLSPKRTGIADSTFSYGPKNYMTVKLEGPASNRLAASLADYLNPTLPTVVPDGAPAS